MIYELETQLYYMLSQIYQDCDTEDEQKMIASVILANCGQETAKCTVMDAFTEPQFRIGTAIALWVMFWHEMVGNNAIMLYSNQMLDDMSPEKAFFNPREGTYCIGVVNFISSALSVLTAKTFTRRFILIYGFLAMGLAHISVGVFAYY